jgi:hypothetical protein
MWRCRPSKGLRLCARNNAGDDAAVLSIGTRRYVKYGTELAGIPVGETGVPLQALSSEEKAMFPCPSSSLRSHRLFRIEGFGQGR